MEQSETVLKAFVKQLTEASGALVEEIEPNGLEIISTQELQQKLKLPELTRLGFALERPKGAERVGLETEWLERLGRLLGQKGQFLRSIVPLSIQTMQTPSNPKRILEHNLTLQNAVYRLVKVSPAWTRYLIFIFHYTAFSDEKRDSILRLGINLSNGSLVDNFIETLLREAIQDSRLLDESIKLPPLWTTNQLNYFLEQALPRAIDSNLSQFLAGLKRRQERDLARIYDYHKQLRRESLLRMRKQPAETEKEQAKIQAITREYQAKIVDLQQKYDLRIDVEWVQTLEVIMPVQRFELIIKRRKGERHFHLDWNPLAKKLESAPCEYSYSLEGKRMVCDDALHIVSELAHRDCSSCAKAYCRACHLLKCPKCGKSKT
ncbi:MAG: hypothetical protein FD167_300 [bacterium]|nr:MAG: hypothetical protein FD167_300 [bacterium]